MHDHVAHVAQVWETVSSLNPLPPTHLPHILTALTSLPRALLACTRTHDALHHMHMFVVQTPANIMREMRDAMLVKYAMWMQRGMALGECVTCMQRCVMDVCVKHRMYADMMASHACRAAWCDDTMYAPSMSYC